MQVSKLLGLPYSRLRLAIPEELHRGSLLHALGLTQPMSVANSGAILAEASERNRGHGLMLYSRGGKKAQSRIEMIIGAAGPLSVYSDEPGDDTGRSGAKRRALRRGAEAAPSLKSTPSGDEIVATGTHYRTPKRAGAKFSPSDNPRPAAMGMGAPSPRMLDSADMAPSASASAAPPSQRQRRASSSSAVGGAGGSARGGATSGRVSVPKLGGPSTLRDGKVATLESSMADGEWVVGTAFMYALLYQMRLLPYDKLAARQRRTALLLNEITRRVAGFSSICSLVFLSRRR